MRLKLDENLPGGARLAAAAVIRVDQQDVSTAVGTVRSFLSSEQRGKLTGCIVVVRGHLVRVRRPEYWMVELLLATCGSD